MDGQGESYGPKRLGGEVDEGMFHERGRWVVGHGTEDYRIVEIKNSGFNRTAKQENDWYDHTSTNAHDPIRTPQLSVLGRE